MIVHYIRTIRPDGLETFTVIPLPLSKERQRARGFNQSSLIARSVAEQLSLPYTENILHRTRHRPPQSETEDVEERKNNIRGCFAVAEGAGAVPAAGKNIIVIDDVVTSGNTFNESARTLKDAGAQRILAVAVARA